MRKIISFSLTLLLCSTLITVNEVKSFSAELNGLSFKSTSFMGNEVTVGSNIIKKRSSYFSEELNLPVVKGLKDVKFQQQLNSEIEKKIVLFGEKLEKDAKEYEKYAKEKGFPFHPYELVAVYKVHYNKNNLLSYTVEIYYYTGGAHGMTERTSYNIDTKIPKILELKDLFNNNNNYKEVINKEIMKKINESPQGSFFSNGFKSISDKQPFYLTEKGIVIYFGLYEIAPYVMGFPEFIMPIEMFNGK